MEHLAAAAAGGKGVLLLTAHFGNWELLAASHALSDYALSVVMRPMDDPLVDRLVQRFRQRSGVELIAKRRALREILEALRRGRLVGVLLDQNASRAEGVFAPFFGLPASTSKSLAVISLRTGAPVVPVFIRRLDGGRHRVEVRPADRRAADRRRGRLHRGVQPEHRDGHSPRTRPVVLDAQPMEDPAASRGGVSRMRVWPLIAAVAAAAWLGVLAPASGQDARELIAPYLRAREGRIGRQGRGPGLCGLAATQRASVAVHRRLRAAPAVFRGLGRRPGRREGALSRFAQSVHGGRRRRIGGARRPRERAACGRAVAS